MAGWVGAQELLNREVKTIDEIVGIIDGLTVDDLQRVARDVIAQGKLNLAEVGPFHSRARFERLNAGWALLGYVHAGSGRLVPNAGSAVDAARPTRTRKEP